MTVTDVTLKPKWRAHETFFIRKGWISKGMLAVRDKDDLFVDKNINQMDELGIGSNMVKSLRYWLQAAGVTIEESDPERRGKRVQHITPLGEIILEYDPFLEELGTLWTLHYELVNKREFVPAWYFFFNVFKMKSFSLDDFTRLLDSYAINDLGVEKPPAARLSSDDFNCILGTYISKGRLQSNRVSPENNIDCPFGELELIAVESLKERTYRKRQTNIELLPPLIVMYSILRYAESFRREAIFDDSITFNLEELLNRPGSPGRAFNLDSFSLLDLLRRLENQGLLHVVRTAGLDEIRIESPLSPNECLIEYYKEVG